LVFRLAHKATPRHCVRAVVPCAWLYRRVAAITAYAAVAPRRATPVAKPFWLATLLRLAHSTTPAAMTELMWAAMSPGRRLDNVFFLCVTVRDGFVSTSVCCLVYRTCAPSLRSRLYQRPPAGDSPAYPTPSTLSRPLLFFSAPSPGRADAGSTTFAYV